MTQELMDVVDAGDFRRLFVEYLGWGSPTQTSMAVSLDDTTTVTLAQVATYRGMGVWHCPVIPDGKAQRVIDSQVAAKNTERLIIYTEGSRQEWRWPRHAGKRLTGRPSLVPHRHEVGQYNPNLRDRLALITIPMGSQITVPELLQSMREAFDAEAETASKQAARLMGALYSQLETAGMGEKHASGFLARILFLMFGDDTEMWKPHLFHDFLTEHTALDGSDLDDRLVEAFNIANASERDRPKRISPGLVDLPYINGEIFSDPLEIPPLTKEFRQSLIEACKFDWGQISPAVFGSMFQTVKSREARRHLGEHYTNERSILKTIEPLFLDELHDRFEAAYDNKAELTKLHNSLGHMRYLDPACGCGNFLIVAYRELRALELEILKRRRDLDLEDGQTERAQLTIDATIGLKVSLDQFYGFEIEPWPAHIARTAMFLVDHQANRRMQSELGEAPTRLPITITPHIQIANALTTDWDRYVTPGANTMIFGNPPFLGQYTKTKEQTELTKAVWGGLYNGYLDYVTCWYKKALDFYGKQPGRWAFVSTNSISQGEAVAPLWRPILAAGWRCRFAHRSFRWESEAAGQAAVHVSIIGFDRQTSPPPALWVYPEGARDEPTLLTARNINPYLVDYRDVFVEPVTDPLSASLPSVTYGSKPTDQQNLIVEPEDYAVVKADPIARKYLRRLIGARELLHDEERWCLWLNKATPGEIKASPVLKTRVAAVRKFRLASSDAQTRNAAEWPHRFQYDRQLDEPYLAIPAHVSEHRAYFTAAYYNPTVICGNANFMVPDPDGYLLAVLSSTMFMTWQKSIGGRLKSDIRFSNTFSYNTFPLPAVDKKTRELLSALGRALVAAREVHTGKSLADLYDPVTMPANVLAAHANIDHEVDSHFGVDQGASLEARQDRLFSLYEALAARDQLFDPPHARRKSR